MTRLYLLILIISASVTCASAQKEIKGTVVDSVSGAPLKSANVMVTRNDKSVAFTKTRADGTFTVKANDGDGLAVTFLGYAKKSISAPLKADITVRLVRSSFMLKEVAINAGRITGKQDTITFNLKDFADRRDNSLKDVLKKLPGVDVSDNGQVSYNGKAINRFTVEDLDLSGGRYNKLSESLKAKDVEKAEVIEHDQPVKALRDKVFTDDVAMNIKLTDEARDKWMISLNPALTTEFTMKSTEPQGSVNALQIGRKRQQMYDAEYDVSGRDLALNDNLLATGGTTGYASGESVPSWFSMPSLSAPIDEERLRFNRSQSYSFKRTSKNGDEGELRITAGYLQTKERQSIKNRSLYYMDGDEPIQTDETSTARMRNDRLYADFTLNTNTEKAYGNEYFLMEGTQGKGLSAIENSGNNDYSQTVKQQAVRLSNTFTRMMTWKENTISIFSNIDFHHAPSSMAVNGAEEKLKTTLFYTDNYAKYIHKRRTFSQTVTAGATVNNINVSDGNTALTFYVKPGLQYKTLKTLFSINVPVSLDNYTQRGMSYLNVSPTLYLQLKPGVRSELIFSALYDRDTGGWDRFAVKERMTDYRTFVTNSGTIPVNGTFSATAYYNYKRPIREFFFTASAGYTRMWRNLMTDLTIIDNNYVLNTLAKDNALSSVNASATVSKGFFDIHLKAKLQANAYYNEGKQLSGGSLYDYESKTLRLSPELIFSPSFGTFTYRGTFGISEMKSGGTAENSMFNHVQRLSYTQSIGKVDISLSGVYYHNELQDGNNINTMLADAAVVWRTKKTRTSLTLRNMFNKDSYAVTSYSGVSTSTTYYILRPRELMVEFRLYI